MIHSLVENEMIGRRAVKSTYQCRERHGGGCVLCRLGK